MIIKIEADTPQSEIVRIAKEKHCLYVVCWNDHYTGNSKGVYYTLETFSNSNLFFWSTNVEDRGTISCYITDLDIPTEVEKKRKLVNQLTRIVFDLRNLRKSFPSYQRIDRRWSKKNPKYINATAHNEKVECDYNAAEKILLSKRDAVIKELDKYSHVSSSFWNCLA